jgi:hypothetical protein
MRAEFLLLAAFVVTIPVQGAEVSPITVRVEQASGNASSNRFKHTQSKALKAYVSNAATTDSPGLRVKYFYFAKSFKTGETTILRQGEQKVDLKGHATVTVEAPEVESVYTEEHGQRFDGKGGRGAILGNNPARQKNVRYKAVEATGTKVTGYGVQVFSGNQVVAEIFSEPSLKALIK